MGYDRQNIYQLQPHTMINRRQFIQNTGLIAAATAIGINAGKAEEKIVSAVKWPVGCFNRPWVDVKAGYTYEDALDGISAAGYEWTGLLTPFKDNPFIDEAATEEYLVKLKKQLADRKLKCVMAALHTKPKLTVADSIKNVRREIDNASILGVEFLLTFGVDDAADFENYYKVMADAAAFAQEQGIKLVMKPHGGGSGSSVH
jgi:sugar phosphate isomerase/epimerase